MKEKIPMPPQSIATAVVVMQVTKHNGNSTHESNAYAVKTNSPFPPPGPSNALKKEKTVATAMIGMAANSRRKTLPIAFATLGTTFP